MKAYIRLFKNIFIYLFILFTIKVFADLFQPFSLQRRLLLYRSKLRSAVAVITLDEQHLREFYWKENVTNIIEQYQAKGFYSLEDENHATGNSRSFHHVFLRNHANSINNFESNIRDNNKFKDNQREGRLDRSIDLSKIPGIHSGLITDWWYDTCFQRTTWERTWYPLFPELPQNRTITRNAGDPNLITGNYLRRIYGFLYTNHTGFYHIQLLSRDGAELMIADTSIRLQNDKKILQSDGFHKSIEASTSVLYAKLTKEDMEKEEPFMQMEHMFTTDPQKVWLTAGVVYSIEVIQGGDLYTCFSVRWKRSGGTEKLKTIGAENLFYTNAMLREIAPSKLLKHSKLKEIFPMDNDERRRVSFFKIPTLKDAQSKIKSSPYQCPVMGQRPRRYQKLYDGFLQNVENTISYPREFFLFKYHSRLKDMLMDEKEAVKISDQMLEKLNVLYNGKLQLDRIVHVQSNLNETQRWRSQWKQHDDWRDRYYFIELDVKMQDDYENKVFRTSHFIRPSPGGPCFIREYQWRKNVTINLLTPIRNQVVWFTYLVKSVEKLMLRIKERNIRLVIVDNNSTDGNYEQILAAHKVPYLYLNLNVEKFNKVKSLNYGLERITDENSIVFIQDLHLQLPLNIFDRIRKMTIEGQTAFAPTLLKFACGEHEQYTKLKNSVWLDDGTGMLAMYKSDFTSIRGFNEDLYSTRWGGEDWEIIDRIVGKGLYVIHHRLPRFYHLYHPKRGMWN